MASPALSSGRKTPETWRIWSADGVPTDAWIADTSLAETVLSVVTTTWPLASSTYQAMPP
jgi:hypothetical protein